VSSDASVEVISPTNVTNQTATSVGASIIRQDEQHCRYQAGATSVRESMILRFSNEKNVMLFFLKITFQKVVLFVELYSSQYKK